MKFVQVHCTVLYSRVTTGKKKGNLKRKGRKRKLENAILYTHTHTVYCIPIQITASYSAYKLSDPSKFVSSNIYFVHKQ